MSEELTQQNSDHDSSAEDYHHVDSGMVEVSLALAALIFTVATLSTNNFDLPIYILFVLLLLVLLSNFTALWCLAAYCVQQNVVSGNPKDAWYKPSVIVRLVNLRAGLYGVLAICIIGLFFLFFFVFLYTLSNVPTT